MSTMVNVFVTKESQRVLEHSKGLVAVELGLLDVGILILTVIVIGPCRGLGGHDIELKVFLKCILDIIKKLGLNLYMSWFLV